MNIRKEWAENWRDKSFEELKSTLCDIKIRDDYSYRCGTHIDLLNDIINTSNIQHVIEFGGGFWSTSLLLNKCKTVITIEQGQDVAKEINESWGELLKELYSSSPQWTLIMSPGEEDWKELEFNECDMVFIDGHPSSRHKVLQYFIEMNCAIIVAHNTEHDELNWSKVEINEYERVDFFGYHENQTSLWTKDRRLINSLSKLPNYIWVKKQDARDFDRKLKKIISFSLWGSNPMYWVGAIKNIQLAKYFYPGWNCRFYIDKSSSNDLIDSIGENEAEIVLMDPAEPFAGLFWRFYAAEDADIMICRDADSRISDREVSAVKQWVRSGRHFHIMRDHQQHTALIMGGMWGCTNIDGIKELIDHFPYKSIKGMDQIFLAQNIYPQVKHSAMIHDSYNLFGDGIDFPTPRTSDDFVGRVYRHDNVPY
ncbi:O-methyltransferase [Chitinophaga rhizosphaerae]|uniref:hypothetical protein n=1 Tax=Chitinophaga rhizosphaerae TaxID=1864947 RepID=UPI000F803C63|nr:hypothetical protein [Chitinophaga rhizosphaerae]